jgi:hypothetical protein
MRSETDILKEVNRIFEKLVDEKDEKWIQYKIGYLKALKWVLK